MSENAVCPFCGQKIVTYKHRLNKVLISALFKLRENGGRGKVNDIGLSHSEFANMQKLQYFGLVEKDGSVYILNELGKLFLENKAKVPSVVFTKHGKLVGTSDMSFANEINAYVQVKEEWQKQAEF